jgi:hypothetical protein
MAYITKFAPTMSRIMINKPMAAWSDSNLSIPCRGAGCATLAPHASAGERPALH